MTQVDVKRAATDLSLHILRWTGELRATRVRGTTTSGMAADCCKETEALLGYIALATLAMAGEGGRRIHLAVADGRPIRDLSTGKVVSLIVSCAGVVRGSTLLPDGIRSDELAVMGRFVALRNRLTHETRVSDQQVLDLLALAQQMCTSSLMTATWKWYAEST